MASNASKGRFFPVPGLHLGIAQDPRKFNQANLPYDIPQAAGSTAQFGIGGGLGQIFELDGACYRLVRFFATNTATIDGGVAYWKDKANSVVTAKASESEGLADTIAGGTHVVIATDAVTTNNHYLFIQVGGDQAAVVVAASAVAGDHLTGHATNDNVLTRTAGGTASPDIQAGTALSTRGTTTSDNGASVANSSKVRWVLGNLL